MSKTYLEKHVDLLIFKAVLYQMQHDESMNQSVKDILIAKMQDSDLSLAVICALKNPERKIAAIKEYREAMPYKVGLKEAKEIMDKTFIELDFDKKKDY